MQFEGRYVQFCKAGTPDLIAYFKFKGICWVYFIEVKSPNGILRPAQKEFRDKFLAVNNVVYEVVRHPSQIDRTIESITDHSERELNEIPYPG